MQSINDKVISRIYGHGKGYVFSAEAFNDIASRNSIDKALSQLYKQQIIRRLALGTYDYPRFNEQLGGALSPDLQEVAKVVAKKHGWRIQPSGALAANLLGLSTQVPAKTIYLTDGQSKIMNIGNRKLIFKRVPPRELLPGSKTVILVTQALRNLGKAAAVDKSVINYLRGILKDKDKKALLKEAGHMESWMWEAIKQICKAE
ncbi:MAG: DUF6088 family protein [Victivallaceae bacterium]|nr:DUF6088 family protein [Victivallaceae bacterium]